MRFCTRKFSREMLVAFLQTTRARMQADNMTTYELDVFLKLLNAPLGEINVASPSETAAPDAQA